MGCKLRQPLVHTTLDRSWYRAHRDPGSLPPITFGSMPGAPERHCLQCGDPLKGRTDKRFCSDSCRNLYHYHTNSSPLNYVRNVINALRRNRRILAELNPNGKTKVHRDKLLQQGYNFKYHTNTHRTRNDDVYVFCFEQGFLELSENWFVLVRNDDYLERAGDPRADVGAGGP